jgi:hypothetical protein
MTQTQFEVHLEIALKFVNSATANPVNGYDTNGFNTYIQFLKDQVRDEDMRVKFSHLIDGALLLKGLQLNLILCN